MPIVLAIEPDRSQAAHLQAIVRHQVGAELVLAHTTEGALDAIGDRVPDLVLVPALLSPQDDAALAAALRVIAAAAHVRTLTIPVLANGVKREAPGGMLAKWRKSRAASPEPDGCEPSVFAEQISAYLKEAAEERAELELHILEDEPAPVDEARPPTPISDSDLGLRLFASTLDSDRVTPTFAFDTATPTSDSNLGWVELTQDDAAEEPSIDLSDEVADLAADGELFDGEPVSVYTIGADVDEPALDALDLLPSILEPPAIAEPAVAEAAEAFTPVEDTRVTPEATLFVEPPEPPRADIQPWVPMYLSPGRLWPTLEGVPAETPLPRSEQPDWIELVASLRQDLERRRTEPAADPIAARPSDGGNADDHHLVKKTRAAAKTAKPVQDEWGFFDPEQCGFSTLLAKLEEITEDGTLGR